jgi:uncharacterized protein with ATP-grasp and redox domains
LKVEVECASCLLQRGYLQIKEATVNPSIQFKAMSALLNLLNEEFTPNANPAVLGTQRDRLVKKITGNPDPYAKRKHISNQKAMETLHLVEDFVAKENSVQLRFRKACMCAIVGNVIEFDIPGHNFGYEDIGRLVKNAENDLAIDEISDFFGLAKKEKTVVYLADNAGEIAFDKLLVYELKKLGANVTVAVKEGPALNDATMKDAEYVEMDEVADNIITTGADAVGLIPRECSKEFLKIYNSADLVVAKGMAYAETLTEFSLNAPHVLLLRTKCHPVANYFHVGRDKNIAKIMP